MKFKELQRRLKQLGVTPQEPRRACIYIGFLEQCQQYFKKGIISRVGIKNYPFLKQAVTSASLLNELAYILDVYTGPLVANLISNYKTTIPKTDRGLYNAFFEDYFFSKDTDQVVKDLLSECPVLMHALSRNTENFIENISTACARVLKDKTKIQRLFSDEYLDFNIKTLTKIKTTGSDFHKGGQQVLVFTFSAEEIRNVDFTFKLVYKPSDIEIDCLIAGNSAAARNALDDFHIEKSLYEIFNELIREIHQVNPESTFEFFPTYRILPMVRLSKEPKGDMSIRDAYGYIEHLNYEPSVYVPSSFNRKTGLFPWLTSDYLIFKSSDEKKIAQKFYRIEGQMLAMACSFSMTDLHMENIRVRDYLPNLIDLENSFVQRVNSVSATFMINANMAAINGYQNTDPPRLWNWAIPNPRYSDIYELTYVSPRKPAYSENRLWRMHYGSQQLVNIDKNATYDGFLNGMHLIKRCVQTAKLDDWIENIKNVTVRYLSFGTKYFRGLRNQIFINSFENKHGFDHTLRETIDHVVLEAIQGQYNSYLPPYAENPNFLCLQLHIVDSDFQNMDVPVFYTRIGSRSIYDSRGKEVVVPRNVQTEHGQQPVPINRETFFAGSPFNEILDQQLNIALDEQQWDQRVKMLINDLHERFTFFKVNPDEMVIKESNHG